MSTVIARVLILEEEVRASRVKETLDVYKYIHTYIYIYIHIHTHIYIHLIYFFLGMPMICIISWAQDRTCVTALTMLAP